jgi:hypothetical protein
LALFTEPPIENARDFIGQRLLTAVKVTPRVLKNLAAYENCLKTSISNFVKTAKVEFSP